MQPLPLDPGAYGGTYKLIGGELSLDLINTVSWPGRDREHDWFDRWSNVRTWALAVNLVDVTGANVLGDEDLRGVHRLRDTIASVVVAYAKGEHPSGKAMDSFNRTLSRATARRRVDALTLRWTYTKPQSWLHALAPVVVNAAEVLTSSDPTRIGYCPSCDWVFHDTTRNGRRRWCDMADCGSRAKARTHYHRQHP